MWSLYRPAESIYHCQSWYSSFQTKSLQYQRSNFWLGQVGKLSKYNLYLWSTQRFHHQILAISYKHTWHKSTNKISKTHYFADDTNLLYTSSSLKEINKNTNFDLSHLVKLLRANKIALNVNKTDVAII